MPYKENLTGTTYQTRSLAKRVIDKPLQSSKDDRTRTLVMRGGIRAGTYRLTDWQVPGEPDALRPARKLSPGEHRSIVEGYRTAETYVDAPRETLGKARPMPIAERKADVPRNNFRQVKVLKRGDIIVSPLDGQTLCRVVDNRSYRYGGNGRRMLVFRQIAANVRHSEVLTGTTRVAMGKL